MGSIGCGGLGVAGKGGDSVIRVQNNILGTNVSFESPEAITQTISQSVSIVVV